MGTHEVEAFLTHLAVRGRVSASTQNQALAALLYQQVLGIRTTIIYTHVAGKVAAPA